MMAGIAVLDGVRGAKHQPRGHLRMWTPAISYRKSALPKREGWRATGSPLPSLPMEPLI